MTTLIPVAITISVKIIDSDVSAPVNKSKSDLILVNIFEVCLSKKKNNHYL